jgi:hypothetical protein
MYFLICMYKFILFFTCWYFTHGSIAGRYFGFVFVYVLFVVCIKLNVNNASDNNAS